MPSACALRVIILAKSSSLPPIASAITTAASLADRVINPLMASSTRMVWPGRRSSLVGCVLRYRHFRVELHLAGVEALEQQIERHHLGERGRVPRRVGIGGRQRRAGVAVDDDRRKRRAIAFFRVMVVCMAGRVPMPMACIRAVD